MKALLEEQGLAAALEELPIAIITAYDNVIPEKAFSALILCLGDRVLREITKESTTIGIWKKSEHIDKFHKLVGDLAAIDTAVSDEKMTEAKGGGGEGLYVRGRSGQRGNRKRGIWSRVSCSRADEYEIADVMMYDGGNILLSDGKECRVRGIVWSVQGLWAEDITMSTYLVNRSPSSVIGFKTLVDMLGFFGWLASIKQRMLEPVKVNCIFLRYHEGKGLVQVLQAVEFEMKPQEDHTFGWNLMGMSIMYYREDNYEATFAVVVVEKIYAHDSLTFNDTVACEAISKCNAGLKEDMDARSYVYVLSNGCKKSSDDINDYYCEYVPGLLDKTKRNILGTEIVRDQSGNTLRVSQSRFYNEKLVQTLLKGHSILSLEGSLSGDCDVEKNGKWSCIYAVESLQVYHGVCTRPDIALAYVGSCWNAYVQYMEALSTIEAAYMTITKAAKEAIWLKGLAIESGFELNIVAGIVTGALSKAIPGPRLQHRLNLLSIGID
ncbi:hypothetical protein Tco_0356700 [Tanacetum coccineum]